MKQLKHLFVKLKKERKCRGSSLVSQRFLSYVQSLAYSRDPFGVPLLVPEVWGRPAPLSWSWTLQEPPRQCLIQLQHSLPVQQGTILTQFHLALHNSVRARVRVCVGAFLAKRRCPRGCLAGQLVWEEQTTM